MKLQDIMETPLPDDWDASIFSNKTSFKTKLEYAKQRAKQVGKGSSRVAFIIEYQDRQTVLKVALNKKGLEQNKVEAKLLTDSTLTNLDITIPIIDYDDKNPLPTWIHTELAQKATENKLCDLMKCPSLLFLIKLAKSLIKNPSLYTRYMNEIEENKRETCTEYANALSDIMFNFDIEIDDLMTPKNWGIYKGKPVIIDIGLSFEVRDKYYLR